jgi:hypothetical protein
LQDELTSTKIFVFYTIKSSSAKSMNLPRSEKKIPVVRADNQWPDGGENFLIAALDVSFFAA